MSEERDAGWKKGAEGKEVVAIGGGGVETRL